MQNTTRSIPLAMKSLAIGSALILTTTSCTTTNAYTGERQISKTAGGAGIGAAGGALLGTIIGNNVGDGDGRRGALIGAAVGGLAGGGIGNYMDRQEAAIRQQLQGSGVSVTRNGNNIELNMPQDITFNVGGSQLRSEFVNTLDSVALVLAKYDKTQVQVNGHTDSDGGLSYNQQLSEQRASTVSNFLASRSVNPQRLITRGFGETQPIASNNSSNGKALNRRVEIFIVPREQQF